jgi:hypothetical protein
MRNTNTRRSKQSETTPENEITCTPEKLIALVTEAIADDRGRDHADPMSPRERAEHLVATISGHGDARAA